MIMLESMAKASQQLQGAMHEFGTRVSMALLTINARWYGVTVTKNADETYSLTGTPERLVSLFRK